MKNLLLSLLFLILLQSCYNKNSSYNLLEDMDKWENDTSMQLTDGMLVINGEFDSYVYNCGLFNTFENFELTARIMTLPEANAAILFHTNKRDLDQGYEVVIDNSEVGNWDRLLKTGSLTSVRNIYYNMVSSNEWFDLKIRVLENHIYISINDYPVVDYIEPQMPFRPVQIEKRKLGAGTFAIKTLYKNTTLKIASLQVKKLPPAEKRKNKDAQFTTQITQFHFRHLPVVDFHVHEKGDLTIPILVDRSAKNGINYGIAANCGLKFPIQNDEELESYLTSIDGLPMFKAMQAEGREWVDMFSPELVAKFDYAFTDAMTWTNKRGVRMRLWMPEETDVGEPNDFMEQLVSQIEKVVTEPIAIYVNPTYLPEEIAGRYDELWTDERIDRVIQALKANDVALEINSRLQLPGDKFIIAAKKEGIKFAMGTNNNNSENLGNLEWSIKMVEKHHLQPADMFLPE